MSLYMLSYMDQPKLRAHVHRSLNRGEAFHQLVAALRKVAGNKIPGRNEIQLEFHNQCTRRIANCIIFYNASILSCLYENCENNKDEEQCSLIKRLSPIAWQHINLLGKYEFCHSGKTLDVKGLLAPLLEISKINFSPQRKS